MLSTECYNCRLQSHLSHFETTYPDCTTTSVLLHICTYLCACAEAPVSYML